MKTPLSPSNSKLQPAASALLGLCLLSAFLALAGTGCKSEPSGNVAIDPTGIYALISVDGKDLPCALSHEGMSPTIKTGVFTINADSNCTSVITFSLPQRGDLSKEVKATYVREGANLTLTWEGAGMTMGNVNGNTFTMTNESMVFVYRK
jgi:hypothetical protein